MGERAIEVGCMVMIVRGHACQLERVGGVPFIVQAIEPQVSGGWHCQKCNTYDLYPNDFLGAIGSPMGLRGIAPLSWLRRIDEQDDPESTPAAEDVPVTEEKV